MKRAILGLVDFRSRNEVRKVVGEYFKGNSEVFFLQIGSNDGKANDPLRSAILHNKSWQGIFVEPVPFLFERLKRNYAYASRFTFENLAVGEGDTILPFYHLPEDVIIPGRKNRPKWYDQIGSFDKNHIVKHFGSEIVPYIATTDVQCIGLSSLLKRNEVGRLDLLHVDAEGFDAVILRQLDTNLYKPKMILFEHAHLGPGEAAELDDKLRGAGYSLCRLHGDTIATL